MEGAIGVVMACDCLRVHVIACREGEAFGVARRAYRVQPPPNLRGAAAAAVHATGSSTCMQSRAMTGNHTQSWPLCTPPAAAPACNHEQ